MSSHTIDQSSCLPSIAIHYFRPVVKLLSQLHTLKQPRQHLDMGPFPYSSMVFTHLSLEGQRPGFECTHNQGTKYTSNQQ